MSMNRRHNHQITAFATLEKLAAEGRIDAGNAAKWSLLGPIGTGIHAGKSSGDARQGWATGLKGAGNGLLAAILTGVLTRSMVGAAAGGGIANALTARSSAKAHNTKLDLADAAKAEAAASTQKSASVVQPVDANKPPPETVAQSADERREADNKKTLTRRHILKALQRAAQGSMLGGLVGTVGAMEPNLDLTNQDRGERILKGLLYGGLAGAGVGTAEGGARRAFGMDPFLNTVATVGRV